jgi:hypothetical protein
MKELLLSLFCIFILSSCDNTQRRIMELESENRQLKDSLGVLSTNIGKYRFMPIFYPKSPNINLGDTYEAFFIIGVYSNENIPIVTIYDSKFPQLIDTLEYSFEDKGCYMNYKPTSKGHYVFFGNMRIPTFKDTISFPIRWEFDVE